ncbi:MAG: pilus assembly protein N-terminal domain-containing protein [Vulcanimicrobiaceae bacterium]
MIDLRTRTYLASALLGMSLLALRAPAAADNIQLISLQTGHSVSVAAPGLTRVAVGDGRIAGVVPIGTQALVINGKSPGHTTVFVWSGANRMTYEVTVTEQSIDDIARILRAAINDPGVQIVAFNQNLIAEGTVPDIAAFNNLNDVLARFKGLKFTSNGGGNGVIVNAVTIRQPLGSLQSEIASLPGGKDLRVDVDQKGNVIVSGAVRTDAEAQEVLDKVNGLAGPYLGADGKVVDRLGITEASQVDVKVYVLEVDHTAQSQLGLHLNTAFPTNINGPGGGGTYTISSQPSIVGLEDPLPASGVGGLLKVGPFSRLSLLAPSVDLLLTEGHARILSSPDLVTEPGEQADFLVGGQIPIPVS